MIPNTEVAETTDLDGELATLLQSLPPPKNTNVSASGQESEAVGLRGEPMEEFQETTNLQPGSSRHVEDDRPFASWDDRSTIPPPPDETTRRLMSPRYDRLYNGTLMKVKSDSCRPPWFSFPEAWVTLPLRERQRNDQMERLLCLGHDIGRGSIA
eukprot:6491469-Amphidinium_carterae.1